MDGFLSLLKCYTKRGKERGRGEKERREGERARGRESERARGREGESEVIHD